MTRRTLTLATLLTLIALCLVLWGTSYFRAFTIQAMHNHSWAVQLHRGTLYIKWEDIQTRRWHLDAWTDSIRGPRFLDEKGHHFLGFAWGSNPTASPAWTFLGIPLYLLIASLTLLAWRTFSRRRPTPATAFPLDPQTHPSSPPPPPF